MHKIKYLLIAFLFSSFIVQGYGAESVLMVRPVHFGYNPDPAASNAFQRNDVEIGDVQSKALVEFDHYVDLLISEGVDVTVVEDTLSPHTPDSIFPNNWLTVDPKGGLVTYPMLSPNRRLERRKDIIELIKSNFQITSELDLTSYESQNRFLEGTGSIVFDHAHKIAYACRSSRTDPELFHQLCCYMDYKGVLFHAVDLNEVPIYHTNVMLFIGERSAVICLDALTDPTEKKTITKHLLETRRNIISITQEQMNHFCGNILELKTASGEHVIAMSTQAYDAFTEEQIEELSQGARIIHVPLDTIESIGGGGARCMLLDIYASPLHSPF